VKFVFQRSKRTAAKFVSTDVEFLSNADLINVVQSLLNEIDLVASAEAHRSTLFLAASAIEGLFGELLKRVSLGSIPGWPKEGTEYRPVEKLSFFEREKLLKKSGALPKDFEELFKPVRTFRNYMHTERELRELTPIERSSGQAALACLNVLIEKYASERFAAGQIWDLKYGVAQVPASNIIQMPQLIGQEKSFLVSRLPAQKFKEMSFVVNITPNAIFNFLYGCESLDQWKAARVEGRVGPGNSGLDNGQVVCLKWPAWAMGARYTKASEPSPKLRQHPIRVVLDPPNQFAITVDAVKLILDSGADWDFDPHGKVGFMTELGAVTISDLQVILK
jgi:hypothetical protein